MTKVFLRTKKISGGRLSIFLDYYPPIPNKETGKPTRREFLSMYLYAKPKTPLQKQENKETQAIAESIRTKRQIEIQNGQFGFLSRERQNSDFVEYFKSLAEKHKDRNHDYSVWISSVKFFEKFCGGTIRCIEVIEKTCNDFKEYLMDAKRLNAPELKLSQNTAAIYFDKFKTALRQAYKDGLFARDISPMIKAMEKPEVHREYLTLDEVKTLVKTECKNPMLKRAVLFSVLTGLRFGDIQKLTWGEVRQDKDKEGKQIFFLQYTQQKTGGAEVLFLSEEAMKLLGERQEPTSQVFYGLKYSSNTALHLQKWIMKAGITKNITFHNFRHTYATLQLAAGTDLYTVSKNLGHRDIATTQIYAKIVDEKKRESAEKIIIGI